MWHVHDSHAVIPALVCFAATHSEKPPRQLWLTRATCQVTEKKKVSARANCAELQYATLRYATLRYAKETVGCRSSVFVAFKVPINAWPGFLASLFTVPAGVSSPSATHCVCLCLCECVWQGLRYSYPRQSTGKQRAKKKQKTSTLEREREEWSSQRCVGNPTLIKFTKGQFSHLCFSSCTPAEQRRTKKPNLFLTPTDLLKRALALCLQLPRPAVKTRMLRMYSNLCTLCSSILL